MKVLAKESGIKYGTVASYFVKGDTGRLPTVKNLIILAKTLGVEPNVLLASEEFRTPE